jgi:hypothetical protein
VEVFDQEKGAQLPRERPGGAGWEGMAGHLARVADLWA